MARIGQTIEHPFTGERLTFLETAETTSGEYLRVNIEMAPGGSLPRLIRTRVLSNSST